MNVLGPGTPFRRVRVFPDLAANMIIKNNSYCAFSASRRPGPLRSALCEQFHSAALGVGHYFHFTSEEKATQRG